MSLKTDVKGTDYINICQTQRSRFKIFTGEQGRRGSLKYIFEQKKVDQDAKKNMFCFLNMRGKLNVRKI